jgi:ketosteroid isomerase-like protein
MVSPVRIRVPPLKKALQNTGRSSNILVDGDSAAVEMESLSTALTGKPFDNRYCWIVHFSDGTIMEVRAYLDSALVQRLIDENEPSVSQQEQKSR